MNLFIFMKIFFSGIGVINTGYRRFPKNHRKMASGTYTWETMKKMHNPRVFATPLVYEGNIFVIGGCDQLGAPLDTFEYYETAKRKWHNLPNMETKRAAPAAQIVGDKIVAIGGVGETQAPVDAVEVYDIKAKKWFKKESLTEPLQGVSSIVKGRSGVLEFRKTRNSI